MKWKQSVKDLQLENEEAFFDLLKRSPCNPTFYILKVEDTTNVPAHTYYEILMEKYEEEGNLKSFQVARECEYLLRDDREREKTW